VAGRTVVVARDVLCGLYYTVSQKKGPNFETV